MNNKVLYFCTLQTLRLPLACPSLPPLFSLYHAILKKGQQQEQSQKSFWTETSPCGDGTLKNHKQGRMTLQYFHAIPTSCAILACNIHHKTLYMHINLFTPTKWMRNYITKALRSAHSTAFCIYLPHPPFSVAIKLRPPTTHLILHACQHALNIYQTHNKHKMVWKY